MNREGVFPWWVQRCSSASRCKSFPLSLLPYLGVQRRATTYLPCVVECTSAPYSTSTVSYVLSVKRQNSLSTSSSLTIALPNLLDSGSMGTLLPAFFRAEPGGPLSCDCDPLAMAAAGSVVVTGDTGAEGDLERPRAPIPSPSPCTGVGGIPFPLPTTLGCPRNLCHHASENAWSRAEKEASECSSPSSKPKSSPCESRHGVQNHSSLVGTVSSGGSRQWIWKPKRQLL